MKMKNQSLLSRALMMLIVSVIVLSCNSGSKSTETTLDMEEQPEAKVATNPDFQISLAQWSLHKTYFGGAIEDWQEFGRLLKESPDELLKGELDPKDFPEVAAGYGINSIELVNIFYFSKVDDKAYWAEFKQKCDEVGVSVGLIMCDHLGNLGDADPVARKAAVEKHYQWVDVAKFLGAHSIRVNAAGQGTPEEVAANAVDGLSSLAEYAASKNINIIVENHGGYSSDGKWLTGVMTKVGKDNVGTLPDFGNFCIESGAEGCIKEYDRYQGITELMPYAKGVSAKSHDFDENGNETNSDFLRIMKIVKESGFKGYVGIEYEGRELSEDEGIKATKALLEKVFKEL
jgi:sugar phosphate isomerase/epimerase